MVSQVETLDGTCDLNTLYKREGDDGKWLDLAEPPTGFRKPPTCPTCRKALDFTTPRYGRAFKGADLGILERNVASRMLRQLQSVNLAVGKVDKQALDAKLAAAAEETSIVKKWSAPAVAKRRRKNRRAALIERRVFPMDPRMINVGDKGVHGVPPADHKIWQSTVRPLLDAYRQAQEIAKTRSSHIHAWEAAFAYLHKREMDAALKNPQHAPRKPEEHAMRTARMRVGQPKPLADQRYKVQAFWATIRIRLALSQLAQTWLSAIFDRVAEPVEQCTIWSEYISFLLASALQDAEIALEITRGSGSHRQTAETSLLIMQADLKKFCFDVFMARKTGMMKDNREGMIIAVEAARAKANQYMREVVDQHTSVPRDSQTDEKIWLQEHFTDPAESISKEWQAVEMSVRTDAFYQPVSREDILQIVQALDFSASRFT